jgi:hypothetical protein
VQETLAPAIGELALQARVAPVYINVYFSINRVGGARLTFTGMLPCLHTKLSGPGPAQACALLCRP